MDFEKIEKTMAEANGIKVCPVCGTPFKPYHSRQITCGKPHCKKTVHNEKVKEYNRRKREENPEVVRRYKAKKMREYRRRRKDVEARKEQLKDLGDRWQKQSDLNHKVAEYGLQYGEVSKQKVLASVPKIDVTLGGKK